MSVIPLNLQSSFRARFYFIFGKPVLKRRDAGKRAEAVTEQTGREKKRRYCKYRGNRLFCLLSLRIRATSSVSSSKVSLRGFI